MIDSNQPRPIDLDQLRQTIAAAPDGTAATVTRRFLQQVERELTQGRLAIAQANIAAGMAIVTDTLLTGTRA